LPSIQEMREEIAGRDDIAIYALNSGADNRWVVMDYWASEEFTFPALLEEGDDIGQSASNLGIMSYPTNIVVGPDGKVKYASAGRFEYDLRQALGL
jgi:hypothetical protein